MNVESKNMAEKYVFTAELQLRTNKANIAAIKSMIKHGLESKDIGMIDIKLAPSSKKAMVEAEKGIQSVGKAAQQTGDKVARFGRELGSYFTRFAAFSAATMVIYKSLNALRSASEAAITFDRNLIKVGQVLGRTRSQLQDVSKEIFRLSTTYGVASQGLSEVSLTLAQAGYSAQQTKSYLEALAKTELSATFDDIADTTEGLIAIVSQFPEKTKKAEEALGSLNAVAAAFPVESADLITAIRKTGGTFRAAGGDLEQLLGLFTAIRGTTRESADTVATGMKTIFARLQSPKIQQALQSLGVQNLRDSNNMFVGPMEAIKRISEAYNSMDPLSPAAATIITTMAGIRQNAKAVPMLTEFAKAQLAYATALSGQGSLSKEAALAQDALQIQMTKAREAFMEFVNELAQDKEFRAFITTVLELMTALGKLATTFKDVVPYLSIIGAFGVGGYSKRLAAGIFQRRPLGMAQGGKVTGGTPNRDSVPAMLMPGEVVLSKAQVESVDQGFLEALQRGEVQFFADGSLGGRYDTQARKRAMRAHKRYKKRDYTPPSVKASSRLHPVEDRPEPSLMQITGMGITERSTAQYTPPKSSGINLGNITDVGQLANDVNKALDANKLEAQVNSILVAMGVLEDATLGAAEPLKRFKEGSLSQMVTKPGLLDDVYSDKPSKSYKVDTRRTSKRMTADLAGRSAQSDALAQGLLESTGGLSARNRRRLQERSKLDIGSEIQIDPMMRTPQEMNEGYLAENALQAPRKTQKLLAGNYRTNDPRFKQQQSILKPRIQQLRDSGMSRFEAGVQAFQEFEEESRKIRISGTGGIGYPTRFGGRMASNKEIMGYLGSGPNPMNQAIAGSGPRSSLTGTSDATMKLDTATRQLAAQYYKEMKVTGSVTEKQNAYKVAVDRARIAMAEFSQGGKIHSGTVLSSLLPRGGGPGGGGPKDPRFLGGLRTRLGEGLEKTREGISSPRGKGIGRTGLIVGGAVLAQSAAFGDLASSLTGDKKRGAAVQSGALGALTGGGAALAIGLGPAGIAIGAFTGAIINASATLQDFEKNANAEKIEAALKRFSEAVDAAAESEALKQLINAQGREELRIRESGAAGGSAFRESLNQQMANIGKALFEPLSKQRNVQEGYSNFGRVKGQSIGDTGLRASILRRSSTLFDVSGAAQRAQKVLEKRQRDEVSDLSKPIAAEYQSKATKLIQSGDITSFDQLTERFDGFVKYIDLADDGLRNGTIEIEKQWKAQIELAVASKKAADATFQLSGSLSKISLDQNAFADRLRDMIPSEINTSSSAARYRGFEGLNQLGTNKFARDVSSAPVQNKGMLLEINRFKQLMPQILSQKFNPNAFNAEGEGSLESVLQKFGFSESLRSMVGTFVDTEEAFKADNIVKTFADLEGVSKKLMSPLEGIVDSAKNTGDALTEFRNGMLSQLEGFFSQLSARGEARSSALQAGFNVSRQAREFGGLTTQAGLDDIAIRSGVQGSLGTSNVGQLGSSLLNMERRYQASAASGTPDERLKLGINAVTDGLMKLSDVSGRTSDTMKRLGEIEASRASRLGIAEKFFSGSGKERRELTRNVSSARAFASSGADLSDLPMRIQQNVIAGLRDLGETRLPEAGGRTASRILEDSLGRELSGLGLASPEDKERKKLEGDVLRINMEAAEAQKALAARQEIIFNDFVSKMSGVNKEFLAGLGSIIGGSSGGSLNLDALNKAIAAIPHSINMEGRHTVELVLNGATVLTELQPALQTMVEGLIKDGINRFIKERIPDIPSVR